MHPRPLPAPAAAAAVRGGGGAAAAAAGQQRRRRLGRRQRSGGGGGSSGGAAAGAQRACARARTRGACQDSRSGALGPEAAALGPAAAGTGPRLWRWGQSARRRRWPPRQAQPRAPAPHHHAHHHLTTTTTPPLAPPPQLQQEAEAALPPEPEDGPDACPVAFRMPDGSRQQRRFLKTSPAAELFAFCAAKLPEAAAGRAFSLSGTYPGAPALEDRAQSVAEAGVANAMLAVKWL